MKIRTFIKSVLVSCLFFVASGAFATHISAAPRLYFDPASANVTKGTDLPINLQIDVENKSAFGADATITFTSNDLTVKSVTNGGFFSDFSYALSNGKIEIHGFFSALYDSKSGSGTFAVITLNSNKDSGNGNLNFTCSDNSGDTEILDSNGQNILSCSSLNQESLTYASSGSTTGETNACGGTCGSNYNCNPGLYCYNGYCRNPDCPTSNTCGCTPTPKPTIKATATPESNVKSTPQVVTLSNFTPIPSSTPKQSASPQGAASSNQKFDYVRVGIWTALSLLALLLLLGILRLFKGKDNPPKITPPIQTYPVTPPIQNPPQEFPQNPEEPKVPLQIPQNPV